MGSAVGVMWQQLCSYHYSHSVVQWYTLLYLIKIIQLELINEQLSDVEMKMAHLKVNHRYESDRNFA